MGNIANTLNGIVAGFVYMSLQAALILSIIIYTYDTNRRFKHNIKCIWARRSIYATVLVQIFDQSSDIGVLIAWWQYSIQENNKTIDIPHINMTAMAVLSLISLTLSRTISALVVIFFTTHKNKTTKYVDAFLCLWELYVIKQVYLSHKQARRANEEEIINVISVNDDDTNGSMVMDKNDKDGEIEPTQEMKNIKWVEAIFEAFPQALLQSVFVIRTYGSEFDINANNRLFFLFSLFWSVVSASSKFVTIDRDNTIFDPSAHKAKVKTKVKYFLKSIFVV